MNTQEQLSQYQQDIIVGTLLGDASLQTGSQGKTWRYAEERYNQKHKEKI
jgi:hypothetical protein